MYVFDFCPSGEKSNARSHQSLYHGVPVDVIISDFGVAKTTLYRLIKKLGLAKRPTGRSLTEVQIAEINAKYDSGVGITKLIAEYNSSFGTIKSVLINPRTKSEALSISVRQYGDDVIDNVIEAYQSGLTSDETATKIGVSSATVLRFLKMRGVQAREINYECNEHYFDELDSEQKLYWFGFFLADGRLNLRTNASSFFECNLGMKDKNHLELFCKHIGYTGPIRDIEVLHTITHKLYKHANLKITRAHLVGALKRLGFKDVQSGNYWPLTVFDDEQIRHILRGYFDGDGSIYTNDKRGFIWYICGPFKEPLEYFMSKCPVVDRYNAVGSENRWRVRYGGNQIVARICEWLYKDATIWLGRKRKVWGK